MHFSYVLDGGILSTDDGIRSAVPKKRETPELFFMLCPAERPPARMSGLQRRPQWGRESSVKIK